MYALLCKRLSEEAPNFEPPQKPCTFRILLLNKCRDEFENRSKASEEFEHHDGPLAPEEEERRQIAKRKMLGNIKFIGELGKLDILAESILHRCIQVLLQEKKKGRGDMAEDLECLCQIMKTCGRILDTQKGQALMKQYFNRMDLLTENQDLPLRIRFMLRDVIELRQNKWTPRKATNTEGPMPIHQFRDEEQRGRGTGDYRCTSSFAGNRSNIDMFSSSLVSSMSQFHISPGPPFSSLPIHREKFSYPGNGFQNNLGRNQRHQQQNFYPAGGNRQNSNQNERKQNHNANNSQQQQHSSNSKELAPRHKLKMASLTQGSVNVENISLRPVTGSMVYKQANVNKIPVGFNPARPTSFITETIKGSQTAKSAPPLHKDTIPIKQGSLDKNKGKTKDKGPSKDEVLKKVETIMEEYLNSSNVDEALSSYREQKIPDRYMRDVLLSMITHTLDKKDSDRDLAANLITQLKKESLITSTHFVDAFKDLVVQMAEKEQEIPRSYSFVAGFAAHAVSQGLVTLCEISEVTENGAHYPLFLLILQQLLKTQDKAKLTQLFNESKVNLLNQLPEVDRTKERLSEILEGRGLSFLFPLLRIQAELWKQLQADSNPAQFYKWIKDNLDPSHYTDPGFINALMTVLLKYITQESTLGEGCDPQTAPDKALLDKEKALLEKYKAVLEAFLNEHLDLQVTAVHSLQVFCYSLQFPKGMLLRWFVNLYNMEVVEEEAFLKWKEDVTEDYPGKGLALFQVNQWLMWLAEAESEEEEDGDN